MAHADPAAFTTRANAIRNPTSNCGGAVTLTPQPGTEFIPIEFSTNVGVESLYAKAARLHVKWQDNVSCVSVPPPPSHTQSSAILSTTTNASALSSATPNATYTSGNWSGWQISNTSQFVQTGWAIPTVILPPTSYSTYGYYSSIWAGIGGGEGGGSAPLIQSGTSQYLDTTSSTENCGSTGSTPCYFFWYEIVNGPTTTFCPSFDGSSSPSQEICQYTLFDTENGHPMVAHAGDDVGSADGWIPTPGTSPSTGTPVMGICDFTQGWCTHVELIPSTTVPATPEPGTTTEWIVEAPYGGYPMADYGSVALTNSCWSATLTQSEVNNSSVANCVGITSGTTPASIQMVQPYGSITVTSTPGSLSAGGFTTTYSEN